MLCKNDKFTIVKFLYYNEASKYSSVYFEYKKEHDQIQLFYEHYEANYFQIINSNLQRNLMIVWIMQ